MSAPNESGEREIALGLAETLESALSPGANALALRAACDVADILELAALGRLLREFEPHLGRSFPPELEPVRDRLLRTAANARELGTLQPFNDARVELEGLAGELAALEWTPGAEPGRDIATLSAAQTLEDLPLADDRSAASARRVRLTAPVAASLRAALDWLSGAAGFARPLALRAEESLLEISCEGLEPLGLEAAQRVIAAVDGNLGPALRSGETGWIVRVPTVAQRDHFLMLEQGGLRLALPWHAVLRLQMVVDAELETRARRVGMPLLEPFAPLRPRSAERPVAVVAHGLKRGWFAADRVVWRLAADPATPDESARRAGFDRAVVTDDGEIYAVVSGERLLNAVGAPAAPMVSAAFRMPTAAAPETPALPPRAPAATAETKPPAATIVPPVPVLPPRAPTAPKPAPPVKPALPAKPALAAPALAPAARIVTDVLETTSSLSRAAVDPLTSAGERRGAAAFAASNPPSSPGASAAAVMTPPRAPTPRVPTPRVPTLARADVTPMAAPATRSAPTVASPATGVRAAAAISATPAAAPPPVATAPTTPVARVMIPTPAPAPTRLVPPAPSMPEYAAPAHQLPRVTVTRRRALVAEDSLAARVFLVRLLVQRGFEVRTAETAAELDRVLDLGPWDLVLLDVELPDARGERYLRAARERVAVQGPKATVVALVRDTEDRLAAAAAGIRRVLEKPVDAAPLDELIARLPAFAAVSA